MEYLWIVLTVVLICLYGRVTAADTVYSSHWIIKGKLTKEEIESISARHGFQLIEELYDEHFLLVKTDAPVSSRIRAKHLEKRLYNERNVEFVQQEKWLQRSLKDTANFTVQDNRWNDMWYMKQGSVSIDIGIESSWLKGYNGIGISIAIVDNGVDYKHPDLIDRYKQGLDLVDNDNDPFPNGGETHGTKCAGVALATKNTDCVIGVAFKSSLTAVRLIGPSGVLDSAEYRTFTMSNVDIFSMSWGANEGNVFDGPNANSQKGLIKGVTHGRNNRGAIFVTAGGNGGFEDNCNCDGYANSIYTITITSVARTLQPPGYAEPCAAALASTYSGAGGSTDNICSTSTGGTCPCDFTGTSAATPMAAGIFALVLQANPNLTWRDMQYLIVRTSITTGLLYGDFFSNGVRRQDNVFYIPVSDTYGYGLLNTTALIDEALHWTNVDPKHICTLPNTVVNKKIQSNAANRTIESVIITDSCNATVNCVDKLEHVQVWVSFSASLRGSVQLTLESPSGFKSKLLTNRNSDLTAAPTQDWTYMSVQFWDEPPLGTWKLTLSMQMNYAESGSLNSWHLIFHGTGESCTFNVPTTSTEEMTYSSTTAGTRLNTVYSLSSHTIIYTNVASTSPVKDVKSGGGSCDSLCIALAVVMSVLGVLLCVFTICIIKYTRFNKKISALCETEADGKKPSNTKDNDGGHDNHVNVTE